MTDYAYEGVRRLVYGDGATFVPVCTGGQGADTGTELRGCGRFVKADRTVRMSDAGLMPGPNATCKRCGRVEMLFEGFL